MCSRGGAATEAVAQAVTMAEARVGAREAVVKAAEAMEEVVQVVMAAARRSLSETLEGWLWSCQMRKLYHQRCSDRW